MGGFRDDDAEVENLLSQLEEDSLLKLNLNAHTSTHGFNLPNQNTIDHSLEGNLLTRFQNLKSPKPKNPITSNISLENDATLPSHSVLDVELEKRLLALKQPKKTKESSVSPKTPKKKETEEPSSSSSLSTGKGETEEASSKTMKKKETEEFSSSSSLKTPKKKSSSMKKGTEEPSFLSSDKLLDKDLSSSTAKEDSSAIAKGKSESKLRKFVKQLSMGKKQTSSTVSEVDMLLASVKDEVELEKQHKEKNRGMLYEDEEEDADMDINAEDLNVKKLKKELSRASIEEGRLTREAQKVIEWASDVARLEGSVSDESDLEELLKMEEQKMKSENKKKKGKKWSLF